MIDATDVAPGCSSRTSSTTRTVGAAVQRRRQGSQRHRIERRWWAAPVHSRRVFTRHRSIASYIPPSATQSSRLSHSFLFSLFFSPLIRSLCLAGCETLVDGSPLLSLRNRAFLHFVVLCILISSRVSLSLSLSSFSLALSMSGTTSPTRGNFFLFVYLSIRRRAAVARAVGDFRAPSSMTTVRRERATHFPLFFSPPPPPDSFTPLRRSATACLASSRYNCARARASTCMNVQHARI